MRIHSGLFRKPKEFATKAIMPQSASLTQNMNIMHLKAKVSDSRTKWKMYHQNPRRENGLNQRPGVAWT